MRTLLFIVGGVAAAYVLEPKVVAVYVDKTHPVGAPVQPGMMTRDEVVAADMQRAKMPVLAAGALVGYLASRMLK